MTRFERDSFRQAGEYLAQAIELEPDYAAAHAWFAYWHIFQVGQDWAADPNETMRRGGEFAERAIVLDPFDARALSIAGHVRAYLHHNLHEAAGLHQRALELNPNLAMAWALSAMTYAYMGDADEAERRNNRYKALSPLDPHAFIFDVVFIIVPLLRHDYEAAAVAGRAVTQLNPAFTGGYNPYLSALGHLGRKDEAATALRRLLAVEPDWTIERYMSRTPLEPKADREHYAEGLRLSGAP
jgi:tetratricopeptide (TPR) repeat protein